MIYDFILMLISSIAQITNNNVFSKKQLLFVIGQICIMMQQYIIIINNVFLGITFDPFHDDEMKSNF